MANVVKTLLVRFAGAPNDRPPAFYKDIALSLLAAFALLVMIVLLANARFTPAMYGAGMVVLLCFGFATKRIFVGAIVAGIACMRFSIAFLFSPSLTSLVLAMAFAVVAWLLVRLAGQDDYDPSS